MKANLASKLTLAAALTSLTLCAPLLAQNQNQYGNQAQNQNWNQSTQRPRGAREAMKMVPATVLLSKTLESDKAAPGYMFRATLKHKVSLDNGPELPAGTVLQGKVVSDEQPSSGQSRLAIRFTQAQLKDGQIIPIKATIVGVHAPTEDWGDYMSGNNVPNTWTDGTLKVEQIGAVSHTDLHSAIASSNSGVFISKDDKNIKLVSGSQLALAIAEQRPMNNRNGNNNGAYNNGNNGYNGTNGTNGNGTIGR